MFMLTTTLVGSLLAGGDYGGWVVEATTAGDNVYWTSETTVGTQYTFYENYYDIVDIQAWVSYLGFDFGPFDVHDMLTDTDFESLTFGPLPAAFADRVFEEPAPPDPLTMRFDLLTSLDIDGYLHLAIENVEMGTAVYDLGWPFGEVTVNMEQIYLAADISITASNDLCIGDIDGTGDVTADDILTVIGAWGECAYDDEDNTCPADVNFDTFVNVSDLLWVIGQFGPCP